MIDRNCNIHWKVSTIMACIVAGVVGPASAQYQALVQGETIISIGPVISPAHAKPKPGCTIDCERAATQALSSQSTKNIGESVLQPPTNPIPQPTENPISNDNAKQLREANEQLREVKLTFGHNLNQATQRIDHLSQLLKLCQQQLATKSKAQTEAETLAQALKKLEAKYKSLANERDEIAKEASQKIVLSQRQRQAAEAMLGKKQTEAAERAKSLEAESQQRGQHIANLEKQLASLKVQLSKANPNPRVLEERIKAMEAEYKKALTVKGEELRDAMARRATEIKRQAQSEAKKLTSKLRSIESSHQGELAKQQADTRKELKAACDRVKTAMDKWSRSEQAKKILEKEVSELKRQVKALKEHNRESSEKKKRPRKGSKKS